MSSAAVTQITAALFLVLCAWFLVFLTKHKTALAILIVLIPFQFVETRFGSSSVAITYFVLAMFALRDVLRLRMLAPIFALIFAYIISIIFSKNAPQVLHLVYTLSFLSSLGIFLLAYTYGSTTESDEEIRNLLIALNVAVAIYCVVQFFAGAGKGFVPFGIESLAFNSNRDPSDPRLVGPFNSPGVTSSFLMFMTIFCLIQLSLTQGIRRILMTLLTLTNLIALIATGNRGSFLLMIASLPMLMFLLRHELGARRMIAFSVGGVTLVAIASAIALFYSDFGTLYDRLAIVTETIDGLPANRASNLTINAERMFEHLWIGSGPLFMSYEQAESLGRLRTLYDPYPHNLYLFMIRTVGLVGLAALLWAILQMGFAIHAGYRKGGWINDRYGIVRFGLVFVPIFLLDQLRLEFNRAGWIDFSQFVFAMLGLTVAAADKAFMAPYNLASKLK